MGTTRKNSSHYCFIPPPPVSISHKVLRYPLQPNIGLSLILCVYLIPSAREMSFKGLSDYIKELEKQSDLARIKAFVNPELEIGEIADRVFKTSGKALLFENNGTDFPILINAYGTDQRMSMVLGVSDMEKAGEDLITILEKWTGFGNKFYEKLTNLPRMIELMRQMPARSSGKGRCQSIIHNDPDLSILPVLKCWPHDGGRFITLPMVHTVHPDTGKTNMGMYRMQVLDKTTTAMHWQLHKTGASHFREWKRSGKIMPVTVTLGGDPVYAWAATAPLPENIDEYILAGFIRKRRVKLVKCITNDLYIPEDADIVIEGYINPEEEMVWEGPFGDHTGFYSLEDWYPKFHVTCITHRVNAIYPATIVGIPPMEDVLLAKATEKIFLSPVKFALQPEVEDFHMPDAGVAHNLAIVKIRKSYPGQGKKVISALMGAGQMMFTKYMIAVSGNINIRDYTSLLQYVIRNTDLRSDLLRLNGPLDVLDHSSDSFAYGGKLGIDATIKINGELSAAIENDVDDHSDDGLHKDEAILNSLSSVASVKHYPELSLAVAYLNVKEKKSIVTMFYDELSQSAVSPSLRLIIMVDNAVPRDSLYAAVWQTLGNSDPIRDIWIAKDSILVIDGTSKIYHTGKFGRRWPAPVVSDQATIERVDRMWSSLGLGPLVESPSKKYIGAYPSDSAEISAK